MELAEHPCKKPLSDDYFCFPGPLVHLAASEYSIEGKAAILIDWREGVKTQVAASESWC